MTVQRHARRAQAFGQLAAVTVYLFSACSTAGAQGSGSVMELGGMALAVTREERIVLSELGNLARSGSRGLQDRALAAARREVNGRDARHVLALYELEIGGRRGDDAMRARALDVLIPSQLTGRAKLPGYLAVRGQIAFKAGDLETARQLWSRWVEQAPTDPNALAGLARVQLAQKDAPGAMASISRAISLREAFGQAASEAWHRERLSIAQQANLVEPGIASARALVGSYPTPANWRDALIVFRRLTAPQGSIEVDLLRLMRHVGALAQTAEYQRMAQLLRLSGEPMEARSVLDEGIARGLLDARTSPTREIIAETDRAVVDARRGTVLRSTLSDQAGAQVRLGVAQLLAGKRAEAQATFRAAAGNVRGGRYADLAWFWQASFR